MNNNYPTKQIMMAMTNDDVHTITKIIFRFLKEFDVFVINNEKERYFKANAASIMKIKMMLSKHKVITMYEVLNIPQKIIEYPILTKNYDLLQIEYCKFIAQQIKPKHKQTLKNTILNLLKKHNITVETFMDDAMNTIQKTELYSWRRHIKNVYNIKTFDDIINNIPPTLIMWHTVMGNPNLMNSTKYDMIDGELKQIYFKINYTHYLKEE